jgi:hypothetical protein
MRYRDELAIGAAGEHLVCADLLALGYSPARVESAPYDLAVDVGDRLMRLQVKSTRVPRPFPQTKQRHVTGYIWTTRRGKGARRPYERSEIDGLAVVALDRGLIAYIPAPWPQVFQIPTEGHRSSTRAFADYPFERLL